MGKDMRENVFFENMEELFDLGLRSPYPFNTACQVWAQEHEHTPEEWTQWTQMLNWYDGRNGGFAHMVATKGKEYLDFLDATAQ